MALLNVKSLYLQKYFKTKSPRALPVTLAKHLKFLKNASYICNGKRISENTTYSEGVIGLCKINFANERLIERSKYYEYDKSSQFYEAPCRFTIFYNV